MYTHSPKGGNAKIWFPAADPWASTVATLGLRFRFHSIKTHPILMYYNVARCRPSWEGINSKLLLLHTSYFVLQAYLCPL
jgi:hypothetical protein